MKRRLLATVAIFSGFLTVSSGVTAVESWRTYQSRGAQFVVVTRRGMTTVDQAAGLAFLTLLMGLVCVGSIAALATGSASDEANSGSTDAAAEEGSWSCAGCGEQNPANFEERWKCQRDRPTE
jgi:hypothetical protein